MKNLYRTADNRYGTDLHGTGGLYGPGRWHRRGTQILYRTWWIMRVPSAQSLTVFNYLLNPLHPEHSHLRSVSTKPPPFDTRLK